MRARRAAYSRRLGDPSLSYSNVQGGIYVQDDIKIRKNLTVTGGVRYEAQTHVPDKLNFAPRAGFTWAPFKSGKTTLRGSWGIFYDWLPTGTYAQTLQVDGVRQRELNIVNPPFPDPGDVGTSPPTNRYLLGGQSRHGLFAATERGDRADDLAAGDHQRSVHLRLPLLAARRAQPQHADQRRAARSRFRQRRPGDVRRLRPAAHGQRVCELQFRTARPQGRPGGGRPGRRDDDERRRDDDHDGPCGGPSATSGPRFQWNRGLTFAGFYNYGQNQDNTDGAFVIPASLILATEWGPSAFDRRHVTHIAITSTALRNLSARIGISGTSALPLTIRTGTDDNGDLVFNDRPAGVGRNSERTVSTWNTSANFGYSFTLGKKTVTSGGGVQIIGLAGRSHGQSHRHSDDAALPAEPHRERQQPVEPAGVHWIQRHHDLAVLSEADTGFGVAADHVRHERQLLIDPERAPNSDTSRRLGCPQRSESAFVVYWQPARGAHPVRGKGRAHPSSFEQYEPSFSLTVRTPGGR